MSPISCSTISCAARGAIRQGFNFPTTAEFDPVATVPILIEGGRLHLGAADRALIVVAAAAVLLGRTIKGFEIRVVGAAPRAARFGGFNSNQLVLLTFAISGALAGLAGIIEVAGPVGHLQPGISPGYGFTAIIVAFLGRLNPVGILIAGLFLALTFIGGEQAQIAMKIPLDMTKVFQGILLFYVLACEFADSLPHPSGHAACERPPMGLLEAIILAVLAASTPLLLAATGELVVERAGVLNLGVEGMMIVGAACGFGGAWLTGSTFIGALCGIVAGMALSLVFAADDARACGQPGRDRPRADHFRRRAVGPDRRRLRRRADRHGAACCIIPGLTDLPFVGRILFGQDAFVYLSLALVVGDLVVPLPDPRRADPARDRRQPCLGPCARLSGAQDPDVRGDVRRRLRGPCRRLSAARLYAVLHAGHDGGPRLDRAGAGGVRLLAAGPAGDRRLSVRRGHDPAASCAGRGLGIPSQLMSAMPYLATIIVLVLISARAHRRLDRACLTRYRVRPGPLNHPRRARRGARVCGRMLPA